MLDSSDIEEICFMHVPKTAGISWLEGVLASLGPVDLVAEGPNHQSWRPTTRPGPILTYLLHERRVPGCLSLRDYRQMSRRRCYAVAFVRNPFDRFVSAFHFLTRGGAHPRDMADARAHVLPYHGDFASFARDSLAKARPPLLDQIHFRPQHEWLVDEHGRVVADFVGRFENLAADTAKLCERLRLSPVAMPWLNVSPHRPYHSYYDRSTMGLVARVYRTDFAVFGYDAAALDTPKRA